MEKKNLWKIEKKNKFQIFIAALKYKCTGL